MKILTASEIRRVEEECVRAGISTNALMDNAGRAVAGEVRKILGNVNERNILFLIGPGNNGGDGIVAARYLYNWGAKVNLYIFGEKSPDDSRLALARERGIGATFAKEDMISIPRSPASVPVSKRRFRAYPFGARVESM